MISDELFYAIYYTSFYSNVICLLLGLALLRFQARKDKIIILYLFLSVSFDYIGKHIMEWTNVNTNYHSLNTWSFVEFIVVWIFYFQLEDIKKIKILHLISMILFLLMCTIILLYYQSIYEIISAHKLYSALYFSGLSIFLYYKFLNKLDTHLLQKSIFWQNSAFFLYFTGNILMFLMVDYLFAGGVNMFNSWAIHNALTIIKAIGLFCAFIINYNLYSFNNR